MKRILSISLWLILAILVGSFVYLLVTTPVILGETPATRLSALAGWRTDYQPDPQSIEKIQKNFANERILVFVGSWCPECRRPMAHWFSVVESAHLPSQQLTYVGVNPLLDFPLDLIQKWQIKNLPTIIVLCPEQEKEMGRMIAPKVFNLEQEFAQILSQRALVCVTP